jgi:magnesium transporter
MAKKKRKVSKSKLKVGLPPGTVTYVGEKETANLYIDVIDYNEFLYKEVELSSITETNQFKNQEAVSWINVNGLNHVKAIEELGSLYNIHPLILEDIVNTNQRPKLDDFNDYMYVVFKMLYYNSSNELVVEHVSFILGDTFVISFQEAEGDVFNFVRERIRENKGRIRSQKADYLLFALLDAIVDHYFLILEEFGNKIEDLEEMLITNSDDALVYKIQSLKKESIKIRKSIFPLREVINKIEKYQDKLIDADTKTYFRDLYDHTIHVIETTETYRDHIWGLMDMHMTNISNKMNNVMKVLTIIATIFIPLTFLAGIYGMNFENMPELKWEYGYYIFWATLIVIFILMVFYFKKKRWL